MVSLKKVGDRDTQQMGSQELERMTESLSPDGIGPFLSCITSESDADKPPLRRECVRLIAVLARSHDNSSSSSSSRLRLLAPHLPKMVSSVLRRLKDPDSLVRDACVETCGVLAKCYCTLTLLHHHHHHSNNRESSSSSSSPLVDMMVRPLFQSLGEQNRYVQAGSALCLARVIDRAVASTASSDRPAALSLLLVLLPQMLPRLLKLLKNPHFMAKPDLIHLITSILQHQHQHQHHHQQTAGGDDSLSAALTAILEALKSSDWTTRKAASVALASVAVTNAGPLLGSFKTTCITSLETSRFDKVKPVRDAIMHALQSWKSLPVTVSTDSPRPSEAGSSTKENMTGVYHDVSSASDGRWTDASFRKTGPTTALSANSTSASKRRDPLTVRKLCANYVQTCQEPNPNANDWRTEIPLPKTRTTPLVDSRLKESDARSCTKEAFARNEDAKRNQNIKYGYDPIYDKSDCSSVSDLVSEIFETKCVTHDFLDEGDSANLIGNNHRSITEENVSKGPIVLDRKSLDSTLTDLTSHAMHRCCLHASNELAFIKRQLLEIESKQSNLLDLLQVFMNNSVDKVSMLHLKFHNLEHAVDKIAQDIFGSYPSRANSNNLKKNKTIACSPRLSTSTPRPSVESNYGQPSLLSLSNKERWGESAYSRSQSSISVQEGTEQRRDPMLCIMRNIISKSSQKNSGRSVQNSGSNQKKETRSLHFIADCTKKSNLEHKSAFWKKIKELLCAGEIESAYVEVLCTGDDLSLLELMDRTGPVLERLSHGTVDVIIRTLTRHFQNQRFTNTIFPWFQQVVDLSSSHKPGQLILSSKTRMEFLIALREVSDIEYIDPVDRISIVECATKLSQVWGEPPNRKMLADREGILRL